MLINYTLKFALSQIHFCEIHFYIRQVIFRILRKMTIKSQNVSIFDYDAFRKKIDVKTNVNKQIASLKISLEFLKKSNKHSFCLILKLKNK